MDLQINKDKAEEWVKQGAPTHALGYLGDTVKSMSDFAENNGILHKDENEGVSEVEEQIENVTDADDEVNENTTESQETDNTEDTTEGTEVNETDTTETSSESTSSTVDNDILAAFGKSLNETITTAIQTYHDEVVVPLQKELNTLKSGTGTKSVSNNMFENLLGEDWLPASVMANTIKEQFAASDTTSNDETVTDAEVQASTEAVDKELSNDLANSTAGHAFNEF